MVVMTDDPESLQDAVTILAASPSNGPAADAVPVTLEVKTDSWWWKASILVLAVIIGVLSLNIYTTSKDNAAQVVRTKHQQVIDNCRNALTARISDTNAAVLVAGLKLSNVSVNGLLLLREGGIENFSVLAARAVQTEADAAGVAYAAALAARNAWDVTQRIDKDHPCPVPPVGSLSP